MNFNEFVNEVKDNIKLFLPRDYENAEVSTMECHKLNRAYTGLMVRKEGEMLTPTINLNRLYEAYKAQPGVTMETVCRKIADIVIEAPIQVDLKAILNYEDVKDKLFIRVSSAEANKEVLEIVPHQLKEDLAITYHVAVGKNQDGLSSMLITNEMMKEYGVTQEQIHEDAMKSSPRVMVPEVSTMECHKLNRAYTGLMVRKEGEMLTPTINLNQLYEAYKAQPGVTMETVCRKIADIVIEAPIQVDLKSILNYEDVKDKLFIRVSSAEANKEVLENAPHQLKEDLAITYHVAVGKNQDGLSSMLITNEMMKEYGVTQEQIHEDAMKSSP
uniref:DUF5688 family protein n=1 Tax=Blautia sp. TaxID=1955243 RepID=UPI003AB47B09